MQKCSAELTTEHFLSFIYIVAFYKNGAITNATTDINFKRILSDGPEVSLKGSPTVSPTTVALCASEPL